MLEFYVQNKLTIKLTRELFVVFAKSVPYIHIFGVEFLKKTEKSSSVKSWSCRTKLWQSVRCPFTLFFLCSFLNSFEFAVLLQSLFHFFLFFIVLRYYEWITIFVSFSIIFGIEKCEKNWSFWKLLVTSFASVETCEQYFFYR